MINMFLLNWVFTSISHGSSNSASQKHTLPMNFRTVLSANHPWSIIILPFNGQPQRRLNNNNNNGNFRHYVCANYQELMEDKFKWGLAMNGRKICHRRIAAVSISSSQHLVSGWPLARELLCPSHISTSKYWKRIKPRKSKPPSTWLSVWPRCSIPDPLAFVLIRAPSLPRGHDAGHCELLN